MNAYLPAPLDGLGGALEGYDLRCISKLPSEIGILNLKAQYAFGAWLGL